MSCDMLDTFRFGPWPERAGDPGFAGPLVTVNPGCDPSDLVAQAAFKVQVELNSGQGVAFRVLGFILNSRGPRFTLKPGERLHQRSLPDS